jgi:hypothetical protein
VREKKSDIFSLETSEGFFWKEKAGLSLSVLSKEMMNSNKKQERFNREQKERKL